MSEAPNAPAAVRNRDAILQVLRTELGETKTVLEIGSGTGQHAVHFATALPHLTWQTSDLAENHVGIQSWIDSAGLSNLLPPMMLDVADSSVDDRRYAAVFSANTAHIMSQPEVSAMLSIVGRALHDGGRFLLYGPFRVNNEFMGEDNKHFDQSLKSQKSTMGIRDLEWVDGLAAQQGMLRQKMYAMPANNLLLVWAINE